MTNYLNFVTVIFGKDLKEDLEANIVYDSIAQTEVTEKNTQAAWVEIQGLSNVDLTPEFQNAQPNTTALFQKTRLTAVLYCGEPEFVGRNSDFQEIIISKKDDDTELMLFWKAQDIQYLTSIASSIRLNKELSLYLKLKIGDKDINSNKRISIQHLTFTFS